MQPVARDLAGLERSTRRVARALELAPGRLLAVQPRRSGWSPAQHLFHLSLANELSLKNAESLVAEKGLLIRPRGALSPEVVAVLRRGRLPRGAEAPRFVRPPAVVDLDLVREVALGVRQALDRLGPATERIAAAPHGIPHQILGVLSAGEWVRFARMHTAHHLAIVRWLL
jgi:hypothetical protein